MEDVVYTIPERDKNDYMLDDAIENDVISMVFRYKHLPKADTSGGLVRFRSVTPKQNFVQIGDDPSGALHATHLAAMRHRELAADHIAAALWLSVCAPIVKAPKPRVEKHMDSEVTIASEHKFVQASDFNTARAQAGVYKGNFATDVFYLGKVGETGDGRTAHRFGLTFYWSEVSDD